MESDRTAHLYETMAYRCEHQGNERLRDWLLLLAADAAWRAGLEGEAERLHLQLVSRNPYHLLRDYESFAEAVRSPDVQSYIEDLRISFPIETLGDVLRRNGLEVGDDLVARVETAHRERNNGSDPQIFSLRSEAGDHGTDPAPAVVTRPRLAEKSPAKRKRRIRARMQSPSPLVQQWSLEELHEDATAPEATFVSGDETPDFEPTAPGGWIAVAVFAVTLLAALAAAAYCLLGPFLHLF